MRQGILMISCCTDRCATEQVKPVEQVAHIGTVAYYNNLIIKKIKHFFYKLHIT